MQKSIEVLLLPVMDLNVAIDQEIETNPLLEINEDETENLKTQAEDVFNKIKAIESLPNNIPSNYNNDDEENTYERPIVKYIELEENLLKELKYELDDPLEIKIGELIIGNLDSDGYLKVTLEDIAESVGTDNINLVEKVLTTIQTFGPEGIAARDLKECLALQAKNKCPDDLKTITAQIISEYLPELASKKYLQIARKLKENIEKVKQAAKIISSLDPKPARNLRPIKGDIYIKPDITISKDDDSEIYKAHVNREGIPSLRINKTYQEMLNNSALKPEEKEFIQDNIKKALNFIQSIDQRGKTIHKIAEYILEKQKDFFQDGISSLIPMTLEDIAQALDRNKSTISRAISNKYIDTPHGMFPIKALFSQGINEQANGSVASKSIKEEIWGLVEEEEPSAPLSDSDIQEHFSKKGLQIARRTISKYRQSLRILPSNLRKN
ncbi:MAG: RNA polymerase factor sigma-54 [Candidatus Omnitrophica bacterium]|nr:RNA polymerase factor sigma-54 [Candidatus Omnitrophota bacterium]